MTCPKCNKEIPYDHNLCGYCGNLIREKCLDCGEMEIIGRVVCEKALTDAEEIKEEFVSGKIRKLPDFSSRVSQLHALAEALLLLVALIMFLAGIILYVTKHKINPSLFVSAVTLGTMFFVAYKYSSKYFQGNIDKMRQDGERAEQEFFNLPEYERYSEIIKKSEGEEK